MHNCDSCKDDLTIDCHDCDQSQQENQRVVRAMIWDLQSFCNINDLGHPELAEALNKALGDVWDLAHGREV